MLKRFCNRRSGGDTPPHGIFYLGQLNTGPVVSRLNHAWIDGFASRWTWTTLDVGVTNPVYTFTDLLAAVSTAHAYKKKITICIHPITVPDYVYNATAEHYTCHVHPNDYPTVPIWDYSAQQSYKAMLLALADSTVDGYHLRDHPALAGFRVGMIGMKGLDDGDNNLVDSAGYTREKFIQATIDVFHIIQNAFPRTYIYLETGTMYDATASPRLDETTISSLSSEFDGSRFAHYGVFIENLKGDNPAALSQADVNLTLAIEGGSAQLCQACGIWVSGTICTFTAGDDTPVNGFNLAYPSYGCKYYELYYQDLLNAPFEADFYTWQATFAT